MLSKKSVVAAWVPIHKKVCIIKFINADPRNEPLTRLTTKSTSEKLIHSHVLSICYAAQAPPELHLRLAPLLAQCDNI